MWMTAGCSLPDDPKWIARRKREMWKVPARFTRNLRERKRLTRMLAEAFDEIEAAAEEKLRALEDGRDVYE